MASPFSTFRKRQKTWMAVLGVLCMFVFVFGSTQCADPGQGPSQNAVVASTKYGDLREGELYEMRITAATVDRFLVSLVTRTTQAIVQEQKTLEQFQQQIATNMYNSLRSQGLITGADENQISETDLVDTMLLEQRAKQNGLIVSDEAINDFLKQITQDNLTRDDLVSITNEMKIDPRRLFDGLRTRLMALRVRQMFALGLMNAPPAQKWEYYLRLNRRARTEIVPVKVADYIEQVKTPDEATIARFFEEHKEQIHQPGSPEPGFKQPHQVALQYLKADYEAFMDEDAITVEEIEAHYEKFKDTRYLFTEPPEPPVTKDVPEEPQPEADKANSTKPDAESKSDETKGDKAPTEKPAEPKDEAKKPSQDATKPSPEASEAPAKESPPKAQEPKPEAQKNDEKSSPQPESPKSEESGCDETAAEKDAEEQDEKQPDAPATKAADKPADKEPVSKPAEPKPAEPKPADTTPAESQPAATAPAAQPESTETKSEEPDEPKEASLLELSSELNLPQSIRDGVRPKYNPLWRVEKDIRRELAGQKASEKVENVFREIKPALDAYYDTFNAWKADHPDLKGDAEHPRPPRPDFAALAEKHGLTAHETSLLSIYEAATETDVGQALAEMGQRLQRPGYVEAVLETPPLYKAASVQDLLGNQYLYWKVNNVEEHVPQLDDEGIRQQVVAVWKEIQARDLAQKKAEELAKQARDGQPLGELVAGEKGLELVETQPFTWMTAGSPFLGPSAPQMTSVPGVDAPGEDFMSTVFGLEAGQTAVAFNAPKTAAYAIKVTSLEPSLSVLRESFAVESPRQNQNYFALAQNDNFEVSRKWIQDVREEAGLHWNRPAFDLAMRGQR